MTQTKPCRCRHTAEAHEHYHCGTYCSAPGCRCARYRRAPWWRRTKPVKPAEVGDDTCTDCRQPIDLTAQHRKLLVHLEHEAGDGIHVDDAEVIAQWHPTCGPTDAQLAQRGQQ